MMVFPTTLFAGSSLIKCLAKSESLNASALHLGWHVQINRGGITKDILDRAIPYTLSIDGYRVVIIEIGTNDLSNITRESIPAHLLK